MTALCRVGSRESPLALTQTHLVMAALAARWPGLGLPLTTMKTTGDVFLEDRLQAVGDKGLFVKELEQALLSGEIDLAIHSLKDMPADVPPGLAMASILERADPRDVLISPTGQTLMQLPPGARVGTASWRRQRQLEALRPDLDYQPIRGNLNTRLRKLAEGQVDALILAAAGLARMGWLDKVTEYLDPEAVCVPAVGQGILAAEFRADDEATRQRVAALSVPAVNHAMAAERAVLRGLEAGCSVPVGAYARPVAEADSAQLAITVAWFDDALGVLHRAEAVCPVAEAEATGLALARTLRQRSAV